MTAWSTCYIPAEDTVLCNEGSVLWCCVTRWYLGLKAEVGVGLWKSPQQCFKYSAFSMSRLMSGRTDYATRLHGGIVLGLSRPGRLSVYGFQCHRAVNSRSQEVKLHCATGHSLGYLICRTLKIYSTQRKCVPHTYEKRGIYGHWVGDCRTVKEMFAYQRVFSR